MTLGFEPTPTRGPASFRIGVVVFVALLVLLMQSVVARNWPIRIDGATLVVAFLALEMAFWTGLWTALLIGYLAGLYSGVPAGLDAAVAVVQFVVIRIFVARIVGSRWVMVTTIAVMATAGAVLGRVMIYSATTPVSWGMILPAVPAQLIAALLLGWPVFRTLQWVQLQLTPREERG